MQLWKKFSKKVEDSWEKKIHNNINRELSKDMLSLWYRIEKYTYCCAVVIKGLFYIDRTNPLSIYSQYLPQPHQSP